MANYESQMRMLEEGGLLDEGGAIDPVSGNDVPSGSMRDEVRDDIPAKLSEGEFVFPADVVRYIGLESLMKMRSMAKKGLSTMEDMGQMGNSEEAIIPDDTEFNPQIDQFIDELDNGEMGFAEGGFLPPGVTRPGTPSELPTAPIIKQPGGGVPTYETRDYTGPEGEVRSFIFINGAAVFPIPEGFVPSAPGDKTPVADITEKEEVDQGGNSQEDTERTEADAKEYRDYLSEVKALSTVSKDYKTWAETNIPGQLSMANSMVIDPVTGKASFPGVGFKGTIENVVKDFKGIPGMFMTGLEGIKQKETAYKQLEKDSGIKVNDPKYTTKGMFNTTTFNKDAYLKDVARTGLIDDPVTGKRVVDPNIQNLVSGRTTATSGTSTGVTTPTNLYGFREIDDKSLPGAITTNPKTGAITIADNVPTAVGDVPSLTATSELTQKTLDAAKDAAKIASFERQLYAEDAKKREGDKKSRAPNVLAEIRYNVDGKDPITGRTRLEDEQRYREDIASGNYRSGFDSSDSFGGDSAQSVGGGTVSDGEGGLSGTFNKGGLASRKIKPKRKPKMKRGGLASKK